MCVVVEGQHNLAEGILVTSTNFKALQKNILYNLHLKPLYEQENALFSHKRNTCFPSY